MYDSFLCPVDTADTSPMLSYIQGHMTKDDSRTRICLIVTSLSGTRDKSTGFGSSVQPDQLRINSFR